MDNLPLPKLITSIYIKVNNFKINDIHINLNKHFILWRKNTKKGNLFLYSILFYKLKYQPHQLFILIETSVLVIDSFNIMKKHVYF